MKNKTRNEIKEALLGILDFIASLPFFVVAISFMWAGFASVSLNGEAETRKALYVMFFLILLGCLLLVITAYIKSIIKIEKEENKKKTQKDEK